MKSNSMFLNTKKYKYPVLKKTKIFIEFIFRNSIAENIFMFLTFYFCFDFI